MNNERRATINKLASQLQELFGKIDDIKSELETVRDEEQEAFDNMPESFQNGDRGQVSQQAIDNLDYAIDGLNFDEVNSYLESAAE